MSGKTSYLIITLLLVGLLVASNRETLDDIAIAASQFLDLFENQASQKINFPLDSRERFNWHYFPRARNGIQIKEMTAEQKEAAYKLLHTSLSEEGYKKAAGIIQLEDILRQVEGRGANDSFRDPGKFYFTIFGVPSRNEPWAWRLEGHHLSLNFVIINGQLAATTPTFWGANPAQILFGDKKGKRILGKEEDIGRQLIKALNSSQQSKAIIASDAPWDIITGTNRRIEIGAPAGISFTDLTAHQRRLFMDLLKTYLFNNISDFAQAQLNKLQAEGLEHLHFAWAGGMEKGEKHYYRIQGATLLIEYDNTQNNATHIHTVVRDLKNDFGEDVLGKHYESSHHD